MKKTLLTLIALATLALGGCEKDYEYLPDGRWEMTTKPSGYDRTTLTFCGEEVYVANSNPLSRPLEDGTWDYALRDNRHELRLSRTETYFDFDGEAESSTESLTFSIEIDETAGRMRLYYDPVFGSPTEMIFRRI